MFHYENGLKITALDLAVDFTRRQPRGFISHAHVDHMARHELAFCTPTTAKLYQFRFGNRLCRPMPYGEIMDWQGIRLSTHPAGHVLGSAMLLVDDGRERLLYTGDFKLGESATAEAADPPRADILVMESTYGDPFYRLPPRQQSIAKLIDIVQSAIAAGRTPVIQVYVLGKAQEVTRILTSAGIRVLQHPLVYEISRIYSACHCDLGDYALYSPDEIEGAAVVAPPRSQKLAGLRGLIGSTTVSVTGWAHNTGARRGFGFRTDHAVPLSDHADYNDLLYCIERVQPKTIYCTHGPKSFAEHLRGLGHDARLLA